MAYTSVPTVSVGDLYTADNFNTYLRDNFLAGVPDAFTAKGDIAFGEGADTIGILALGNAGDWLNCDAGETLGVKWTPPISIYDWFTFGAFTCATLDDLDFPAASTGLTIVPVSAEFGISDSSARTFLTSLSVRYNGPVNAPTDGVRLLNYSDTNLYSIQAKAFGDEDSTSWGWNTQSGLMMSDTLDRVRILKTDGIGFNITVKIWGYA